MSVYNVRTALRILRTTYNLALREEHKYLYKMWVHYMFNVTYIRTLYISYMYITFEKETTNHYINNTIYLNVFMYILCMFCLGRYIQVFLCGSFVLVETWHFECLANRHFPAFGLPTLYLLYMQEVYTQCSLRSIQLAHKVYLYIPRAYIMTTV